MKLIWAVEPFGDEEKRQEGAISAMNILCAKGTTIEPVYVWNGSVPEGLDENSRRFVAKIRALGAETLTRWTKSRLKAKLLPFTVLPRPLAGSADAASEVLKYAKRKRANGIALSRNLHHGMQAWLLGSFAESLALASDIPVLMAPPSWKAKSGANRVLFPTDFSGASLTAFEEVVDLAKACGWKITLYHKVEQPFYPATEFAFVAASVWEQEYRDLTRSLKARAEKLANAARKRGVHVDVVVDSSRKSRIGESILKRLTKDYVMVALASHSGALARALMGSTSRYLIRNAEVPVWVLRPQIAKKKATKGRPAFIDFLFPTKEKEKAHAATLLMS